MAYTCIQCKKFVNSRQEALLCGGCNKWQHRKCSSGVSREMYRKLWSYTDDVVHCLSPGGLLHVYLKFAYRILFRFVLLLFKFVGF